MRIYTKEEVEWNGADVLESIVNGSLFVYPTDTIYGLGCNALHNKAVARLKQLKQKPKESFLSVIAPSLDWIYEHCDVSREAAAWLKKLPGAFTLVLPLKEQSAVAKEVSPDGKSLGIRIPNHWIWGVVREIGIPLVTTSANVHGRMAMTSLETLDPELKKGLHFVIYEGEKYGKPSQIIDLTSKRAVRKR
ncbi:threonylcarbamoyl-AMP synthase [Candidatus Woesearchaeota archaeon]|nr:threonylcarbamoyl-AMP synthase [Candidatus Woesearchaeota archaeon]